jgi:hypothetical protein
MLSKFISPPGKLQKHQIAERKAGAVCEQHCYLKYRLRTERRIKAAD